MDKQKQFEAALRASRAAVAAVAGMYIRSGQVEVRVPVLHVPKNFEENQPDEGDLFIRKPPSEEWKVIEVKGYKYTVDQMAAFPHLIIERCDLWERKTTVPAFYFTVGSELTSALVFNVAADIQYAVKHKRKGPIHGDIVDCWVAPQQYWRRIKL